MSQFAVVIPVYNGARYIAATLECVQAQTHRDFHVYVVDDGSTDGTKDAVTPFLLDCRFSYVYQTNTGQAAAINRGARMGQEPYIAVCDADDLWRVNRLARTADAFAANPQIGLVCTDYAQGDDPSGSWKSEWDRRHRSDAAIFDRLLVGNFIHRSSATLTRAQFVKHGGFSEWIAGKCGSDDLDMWLKVARDSQVCCIREVLTFYRKWPGQDSRTLRAGESIVRLWESWERELRNQSPRKWHAIARGNLADWLFELAYRRLRTQQGFWRGQRELFRALWWGGRPYPILRTSIVSTVRAVAIWAPRIHWPARKRVMPE